LTALEDINAAIAKIDYILEHKFITDPVREDLNAAKALLQSAAAALSG